MEESFTNKPPLSPKNWGSKMIRRKTGDEKYSKEIKSKDLIQTSLTQSYPGVIANSGFSPSTSSTNTNVAITVARKTPNSKKGWLNQRSFDQGCEPKSQNSDNSISVKGLDNIEGSDDSNSSVKTPQNKYRGSHSCATYNASHSIKSKIIRGLSFNKQISSKSPNISSPKKFSQNMSPPPKCCEGGKRSSLLARDDLDINKGAIVSSTSHAKLLEKLVKPFIRHTEEADSIPSESPPKRIVNEDGVLKFGKSISFSKDENDRENLSGEKLTSTKIKLPIKHLLNEDDEDDDSLYYTPRQSQGNILDIIKPIAPLSKFTNLPNVAKAPSNVLGKLFAKNCNLKGSINKKTIRIHKSDPCLSHQLKDPYQITNLSPSRASSMSNLTQKLRYIKIQNFYKNNTYYSISSDSESIPMSCPVNSQTKFELVNRCNSLSDSHNKTNQFYKNTYHNSLETFRRDTRRQSQSSIYKGKSCKGLKPVTLGKKYANGKEHHRKELMTMMYGGKIGSKYQQKRRHSRSETNAPPTSALLNKYRTLHSTSLPQKPLHPNPSITKAVSESGKTTTKSPTLTRLSLGLGSRGKKKKMLRHLRLSEYEDNFYTSHLAKLPKPDLFQMGYKIKAIRLPKNFVPFVKPRFKLLPLVQNVINKDVLNVKLWQESMANLEDDIRHHIIQEIYDTEYSYIESLIMLIEMYYKPMISNNFLPIPESYLVSQIFETIAELLNFHALFLHKMHSRLIAFEEDTKIGDLFQNMFGSQKIVESYLFFVNNWKLLRKTLMDLKEQNSKFNKFIENQTNYHRGRLNLDALIIMPIQRLPRYELLLKELIKNSDVAHCDNEDLESAKELIQDLAKKVDGLDKSHTGFNP